MFQRVTKFGVSLLNYNTVRQTSFENLVFPVFFFTFCTDFRFWLASCRWGSRPDSPVGTQITKSLIISSGCTLSQLEVSENDFVLCAGNSLKITVFSSQRFCPPASRDHSDRRARCQVPGKDNGVTYTPEIRTHFLRRVALPTDTEISPRLHAFPT